MRELREAIASEGVGIGRDIVKVDMFLNHRIDTGLLFRMGRALADAFAKDHPNLVLTVEASGIALAVATAGALGNLPVIFAKKGTAVNQSSEMLEARAYSFTHRNENILRVDRRLLGMDSRVLIVDDFLADGQAADALMTIAAHAGSTVVGIGIGIEKGFQSGGRKLRENGVKLVSLAVVTGIENGKILLADE